MKKRILCTILALTMVLSATAMTASAKLGEIYSFNFENADIGQITDNSQLDKYFTPVNTGSIKTYVQDSSVLHTQDSTLFTNYSSETSPNVNAGSYSVSDGVLTMNKIEYYYDNTNNKKAAYEIRYADGTLDNYLPTTGSYAVSLKLKTAFKNTQGIQLAFGGHFEFVCTDPDTDTIRVRYHDGSKSWVDVKDANGEYPVWSIADYTEVKFVVDAVNKLTDLYIGDKLVVADVPVRTKYSDFKKIRIIANSATKCTAYVKEINAYKADGSKVMKLDKTDSGTATTQMTYTSLINTCNAKDYTISFDMYPRLTSGSFNLAFGAFFEFARTADGVYTIKDRQGTEPSTRVVKDNVTINDYVTVKIKIKDGKGNLYINNELIDGNVEYRSGYTPETLHIVLNKAMKGSVCIDNIKLYVDSEQDVDAYVTGSYNLNSAGNGYQLNIRAFVPSGTEGDSFRAYAAYYGDEEQTVFLGATLQDVTPGEVISRGWGTSIPKGAVSANVMLWNDSLAPLCDFVTVELVAPAAE